MELKGKVALVTGSSSGIGKAIVLDLAKEGCKVIVNSRKGVKEGREVVDQIVKNGGEAIYVQADVTKEKDVELLFKTIKEQYKKLDILVNNAGYSKSGDTYDFSNWETSFQINVLGYLRTIKHAEKLWPESGKILNVSSVYAEDKAAWPGKAADSASKAAINNLTRTMAKKLAPNILVNAIAPGYTDTRLWEEFSDEVKNSAKKEQLINRLIRPEEISEMAVAIIKNDAMTGEVVVVDGGLSLKTV